MSVISSIDIDTLSNVLHGVLVVDRRGIIRYWNPACENMLGYQHNEIQGRPVRRIYGDEEVTPFRNLLNLCLQQEDLHGRWHAYHKQGHRVWLDVRSRMLLGHSRKPEGCLISLCDVEKLIHTEEKLKRSTAISQAIYDASLDAMVIMNEEARITSVNQAAVRMFGYHRDELVGKTIHKLMPFPWNLEDDNDLEGYLETGLRTILNSRKEVQGVKKDGTIFPIDLGVTEVVWEGHRLFASVIRDLTSQRELEQRLVESGNEERRKIGRNLHDGLGQMLTGIRMFADSLARKLRANALPAADEVQEIADMVKTADQFARTLSRDMVQVDLELRGLGRGIEDLCTKTQRQTGITCTYLESGEGEIDNQTMAVHIYRIVQEALNNAIKHGNPENITVRLSRNNYHTSVSIDDDGHGFDPNSAESSGIGLQVMKYRAGLMNGLFDISRTTENYTRVQCIIPNNLEHF